MTKDQFAQLKLGDLIRVHNHQRIYTVHHLGTYYDQKQVGASWEGFNKSKTATIYLKDAQNWELLKEQRKN